MKLKTKDLEKLRVKLPKKWAETLERRLGSKYREKSIKAVLRGDYNNDLIIDAAIELAEEFQNEEKIRLDKIKNL